MKIGVDISQSTYVGTGSARFAIGLIHSIVKNNSQDEWTLLFSSMRRAIDPKLEQTIKEGKNISLRKLKVPPSAWQHLWNVWHILPVEYLVGKQDWFITSDWTQPPARAKIATLVHDLVYLKYPETVAYKSIRAQQQRLKWAKKESTVFLASSESTKKDLQELLNIDGRKIIVDYPGVDVTVPSEAQIKDTKLKFKIDKPFILTVGKVEPRKNLSKLMEAFSRIVNHDIELLIVGPEGWGNLDKNKFKNVRFLGYADDTELFSLYKSCLFLAFPSLYEGFGFPAVEAMKLGCPVTMSDTSSLAEIGEDTALFFDPQNVDEIKRALDKMIVSEQFKKDLIEKGKLKSRLFTWENYYNRLMEVLRSQ